MKTEKPNYTQIPNAILDGISGFTDAELRVLLCVARQTFGWHRDVFIASVSFIAKATGMSEQGVRNAVAGLLQSGTLTREQYGATFAYAITVENTPSTALTPLNGVDPHPSTALTTPPSTALREINKGTETKLKAGSPPAGGPPAKPLQKQLTDGWCEEWAKHHPGCGPYTFQGAKDGAAAAKLLKTGLTPDQLLAVAREAWKRPEDFNCKQAATLAGFASRFNDIRVELAPKPVPVIKPPTPTPRIVNGNY